MNSCVFQVICRDRHRIDWQLSEKDRLESEEAEENARREQAEADGGGAGQGTGRAGHRYLFCVVHLLWAKPFKKRICLRPDQLSGGEA